MGSREIGRVAVAVIWAGLAVAGCEREPVEWDCPPLVAGDLVVSEIRGEQTDKTDTWGQWFELYNASSGEVDPAGLILAIKKLDGTDSRGIMVRDRTLRLPAGEYFVLGRFPDDLPDHVDYGFEDDFASKLYENAILEVLACGVTIDKVVYYDLPREGSLSFDGNLVPDAVSNDNRDDWCVDDTEVGFPGTPGEVNRPCN